MRPAKRIAKKCHSHSLASSIDCMPENKNFGNRCTHKAHLKKKKEKTFTLRIVVHSWLHILPNECRKKIDPKYE